MLLKAVAQHMSVLTLSQYNSAAAVVDENSISASTTEFHLGSTTFLFISGGRGKD